MAWARRDGPMGYVSPGRRFYNDHSFFRFAFREGIFYVPRLSQQAGRGSTRLRPRRRRERPLETSLGRKTKSRQTETGFEREKDGCRTLSAFFSFSGPPALAHVSMCERAGPVQSRLPAVCVCVRVCVQQPASSFDSYARCFPRYLETCKHARKRLTDIPPLEGGRR